MIHLQEDITFKGCTLIFPSVSVGNTGQLAMDLLINNLKPRRIGMIWHSSIIPLVGGDPFNFSNSSLTTSCEIFYLEKEKYVFFQIRSPILQENNEEFIKNLIKWIKDNCIDKIVILTGSFDYMRHDNELAGPVIKFIVSSSLAEQHEPLKLAVDGQNSPLKLEPGSVIVCNNTHDLNLKTIHGGGISRKLFNVCVSEGLPAAIVMKYCSEGDNIPDAVLLCNKINVWLKLVEPDFKWEQPPSWINMFGNPPQPGLY